MEGFLSARRHCRQREEERGSSARRGLDPDSAVMSFNDALADCEADASTGELSSIVQSFEHDKNSVKEFRADSDPFILH